MKPKPFSALNHFTVPSAMCWFPDCAVCDDRGPAGWRLPRSATVAGPLPGLSRGTSAFRARSERVVTKLEHVAVGIAHVQPDALTLGSEELGRTADDVEDTRVRDGLEVARFDDETHVVDVRDTRPAVVVD